ncbi:MAG TPA: hypothetical protein VF986_05350 [Actinomycetota bacterium]
MRRMLVGVGKKLLPESAIDAYRRRRALRRYLRSLSFEIYDRQVKRHVEELEDAVLTRRPDITEKLMKDLLDRTDLLLQQLHRQIEGLQARHGGELRELREESERLRSALEELQARMSDREPATD